MSLDDTDCDIARNLQDFLDNKMRNGTKEQQAITFVMNITVMKINIKSCLVC